MVFLLSFQLGVYGTMKENVLRIVDGFAQVQPPGYKDNPSIRKTISDPAGLMTKIEAVHGLGTAAPRAMSYVILSRGDKSFGAAILGVDPLLEVAVSRLNNAIVQGRYLSTEDNDAVVLGTRLARNLKVSVGDKVTLLGGALDGSIAADVLTVAGIYDTGTQEIDRQLAEMPLGRFQATFAMNGAVNSIVLSGKTLGDVEGALGGVRRAVATDGFKVLSWQELEPGLNGAINLDFRTSLLWYVSLVIVVVFIILNTLLMSVMERTHEFGVLLAVGMQPGRVGVMIWLELFFLALVGLAIGIGIGDAITLAVTHYGLEMPGAEAIFSKWGLPGRVYPRLGPASMLAGPVAMGTCILLAGVFPYRHVSKLEPVGAMRSGL